MIFESFFFVSIEPIYFFLAALSLVLINALLRYSDDEESRINETATSDPLSQLGLAILAARQESLAPLKKNYNGQVGRFYYPLGFYWYFAQLFKKYPAFNNLFKSKSNTLNSLFENPLII